jgi:AbrB family looped-hinge helix DNA binding protein
MLQAIHEYNRPFDYFCSDNLMSMAGKTATVEKIGRVGQRRQVVIPREIAESLRMREGDFVAITKTADAVVIKRKRIVDADDVLTPKEAKIVRRGEAQLKRGASKPWRDVKECPGALTFRARRKSSF